MRIKKRDQILWAVIVLLVAWIMVYAPKEGSAKTEREYQTKWCKIHGGKTEVVLKDRTRVDCLTKTHAIEFDFAKKWAEAIGQSLHYSRMTGKQPGIVLICKNKKGIKKFKILKEDVIFYKLNIKIWNIGCNE